MVVAASSSGEMFATASDCRGKLLSCVAVCIREISAAFFDAKKESFHDIALWTSPWNSSNRSCTERYWALVRFASKMFVKSTHTAPHAIINYTNIAIAISYSTALIDAPLAALTSIRGCSRPVSSPTHGHSSLELWSSEIWRLRRLLLPL